jgi:hypothetical protein
MGGDPPLVELLLELLVVLLLLASEPGVGGHHPGRPVWLLGGAIRTLNVHSLPALRDESFTSTMTSADGLGAVVPSFEKGNPVLASVKFTPLRVPGVSSCSVSTTDAR